MDTRDVVGAAWCCKICDTDRRFYQDVNRFRPKTNWPKGLWSHVTFPPTGAGQRVNEALDVYVNRGLTW